MAIAPAFPFNDDLGLLLLALSTPHLLYLFTWTCTGAFTRIAKTVGVEAFTLFYKVRGKGGGEGGKEGGRTMLQLTYKTTDTLSHAAYFSLSSFFLPALGAAQVRAIWGPCHVGHEGKSRSMQGGGA